MAVVAQDGAEGVRDVAVEHDEEGLVLRDAVGEPAPDALGEGGEAIVGGMPGQRKASATSRSSADVEGDEMGADRPGELSGSMSSRCERRLQHLQIAPRQQHAGRRDVARVAGELHAVFRGAERGGADAFARRQQRPGQRARSDASRGWRGPAAPMSPKSRVSRSVDVFGDAAGKHDAVDAGPVRGSDRSDKDARRRAASGAPRSPPTSVSAMASATRSMSAASTVSPRSRQNPRAGVVLPAGSSRTILPSSTTCSRPPTCTAAVAITLPFSTSAELGGAAADVDVEDALVLVVEMRAAPEP